jgi:hypothetical protein
VTTTFGPNFDERLDGARVRQQIWEIRTYMLAQTTWKTLREISGTLKYPEASVSAQLRHLRKEQFGGYTVLKRRRDAERGIWEYRVLRPGELPLEAN